MGELDARIRKILSMLDGGQAFLFGPTGEPFIAMGKRVTPSELALLRSALEFIEKQEAHHPRPLLGRDPSGRFVLTALDEREDLWVVVLTFAGGNPAAAAANLADSRADFGELLEPIRRQFRLA